MNPTEAHENNTHSLFSKMGIRTKLIALFIVIKVVPLVLLALVAWQGLSSLGDEMTQQTEGLTSVVRETVDSMGSRFSKEAESALDRRAQEELERLTTDTARAIADFLYERDEDVLQAARLTPSENYYRLFLSGRNRKVVPSGQWKLAEDGKSWVSVDKTTISSETAQVSSGNIENKQDFHYRPPESVVKQISKPLYHEITFVGLDGQETIKVSATDILPKGLRNIAKRENTWASAESYFPALKKLKPGETYVSEVVGPYVGSRVIGPYTPEKAKSLNIPFEPEKAAFAGKENPVGKRFQGIVRWATPVTQGGKIIGYVTLALDHSHIMAFTDHLLPGSERYAPISDASQGNYAFIWDHKDRNIAHPRHHSIVGFDSKTGEYATPWLEASIYEAWQTSEKPLKTFLAEHPIFDGQTREKKPAKQLTQSGLLGLDCRYLNFAPQCQGWHELTEQGGSGSFLILWSGVWKLTTAAAIPYRTGQYAQSPRGFGYVTIGANIDDYHKPAQETAKTMAAKVAEFGNTMKVQQAAFQSLIASTLNSTAASLTISTLLMIGLVVVIAIWLASIFTRRIQSLTDGLQRIELGDYDFRFKRESEDEVGKLTDSLNTMAKGVQDSIRRLEDAKQQAEEASRLKSDFLAHVSHELRTPLNGILGFAELIKDEVVSEDGKEHADTIYQSGERLLGMLNDILDLSKMQAGHMPLSPVQVKLKSLIEALLKEQQASADFKGLRLNCEFNQDTPENLITDPQRLSQALRKLINNAVKFTEKGMVSIKTSVSDSILRIDVIDTGPGIASSVRENLFNHISQCIRFEEREHEGMGLGLAIAKCNAQLLGGSIELVTPENEQGCTFRLSIPLTGSTD